MELITELMDQAQIERSLHVSLMRLLNEIVHLPMYV